MVKVTDQTYATMCAPYVKASKNDAKKDASKKIGDKLPEILDEAGLNDHVISDLIKSINKYNLDGLDGMREQNINNLFKLWKDAQTEETIVKIKEIIAARNYFKAKGTHKGSHKGTNTNSNHIWPNNYIKDYVYPSISFDWINLSSEFNSAISDISNTFNIMSTSYKTGLSVDKNMSNLKSTNAEELKTIMTNINNYKSLANVDTRKNLYQHETQEYYNTIYYYLKICYYGLIVIYIFFGDFIAKSRYKDYRFYIFLVIYIIFPYLIKYIFAYIAYAYDYILKYFNIKKPVYAYSDIIRADNINDIYTAPMNTVNNPINSNNNISNSQMERLYNQYVVNSSV
tara:strand:+ start:3771 stop:4796 length:1026 start_codon:yes stop_codon:yes gene_type:complete